MDQRGPPHRGLHYGALGALLGLGAPGGWLALRVLGGDAPPLGSELSGHATLYAYLLLGTSTAFSVFGVVLGILANQLARAAVRFETLALSDELTGLRNRRYFDQRLVQECARADREGTPLTLVMVDLDLFKRVNDTYGHPAGDAVLTRTGEVLARTARLGDVVCRIGGEEFTVICPGADGLDGLHIAERFRIALASQMPSVHRITASVGVAQRDTRESVEELVRRADQALYEAKRAGRDRAVLSSDASSVVRPRGQHDEAAPQ